MRARASLRTPLVLGLLLAIALSAPLLSPAAAQSSGGLGVTAAVEVAGGVLAIDLQAQQAGRVLVVVTHEDPILGAVADRVLEADVSATASRIILGDLRLGTNFTVRVLDEGATLPGLPNVSRLLHAPSLGDIPTLARIEAPAIGHADANHTRVIDMYPVGGGYDMLGTVTTRSGAAVVLYLTSPTPDTNAIVAWTSLDGGHVFSGPVEVARFNQERRNWAFSEVDGGVAVLVREYNTSSWAPGEELDVDPWRLALFDPHAQRVVHTVAIGESDRVRLGVGNYQFAFLPGGDVITQFSGTSEERNEDGVVVRRLTVADGLQVWRLQQDGDISFVTAVQPPTANYCDVKLSASPTGSLAFSVFLYEDGACVADAFVRALASDGRHFGAWTTVPVPTPPGHQARFGDVALDGTDTLLAPVIATRFEDGSSVDTRSYLVRSPSTGPPLAHELRVPDQTFDFRGARVAVVADGLRSWVVWTREGNVWTRESLDGGLTYGAPVRLQRAGGDPSAIVSFTGDSPLALFPDGRPLLTLTESAGSFSAPLYEPVLDDALLARIIPATLPRLTVEILDGEPPVLLPGGLVTIQARVRSTAATSIVVQLTGTDASGLLEVGSTRLDVPANGVIGAAITVRPSAQLAPGAPASMAQVALRASAAGLAHSATVATPVRVFPTPIEITDPGSIEVSAGETTSFELRVRNLAPVAVDPAFSLRSVPPGVSVQLVGAVSTLAAGAEGVVTVQVRADRSLDTAPAPVELEAFLGDAPASVLARVRLTLRIAVPAEAAPADATPHSPEASSGAMARPAPTVEAAPDPPAIPAPPPQGEGASPDLAAEEGATSAPRRDDGAGPDGGVEREGEGAPDAAPALPSAAVGGATIATVLLAGAAATEAGRSSVALLVAAMYSRLRRSRILEHGARNAIHEIVRQRPGVRFEELRRATYSSYGALAHHLRVLEREGYVTSRLDWAHRRIYPVGQAPASAQSRAVGDRILAALAARPGMSQSDVARALGVSRQLASYHLGALERSGRVALVREGRNVRYSARTTDATPARPARG